MQAISVICLCLLGLMCLLGVFASKFKDNWLQFVGLWGVMLWAFARAYQVAEGAYVSEQQLVAHVSLAIYALGTAMKVWRYPKSDDEQVPLLELAREHWQHVVGRGK